MSTLFLCILWICWCAMHSVLIDTRVIVFLQTRFPGLSRYYRLLFNGLSLISLLPLAIVTRNSGGPVLVSWSLYGLPLRGFLFVAALALFYRAAKKYDLRYFLGLAQLKSGENHLLMGEGEEFSETGVFGITRHPWYLGSLMLIWSLLGEYTLSVFLAACILSLYLVVGTMLEEKKIVARYGDAYRNYQQRVSMLFPWKWLKQRFRGETKNKS